MPPLADRNNIVAAICRIVYKDEPTKFYRSISGIAFRAGIKKYLQLIKTVSDGVVGYIDGEGRIAPAVEDRLGTIDKDCSFVVHGSEVE